MGIQVGTTISWRRSGRGAEPSRKADIEMVSGRSLRMKPVDGQEGEKGSSLRDVEPDA